MNVGMPGSGIGGLFYLLAALWMSISEAALSLRRRSNLRRWRFVGRMVFVAMSILLVLWGAYGLLGYLFAVPAGAGAGGVGRAAEAAVSYRLHLPAILKASLLSALSALACVLGGVEVLSLLARTRSRKRMSASRPNLRPAPERPPGAPPVVIPPV